MAQMKTLNGYEVCDQTARNAASAAQTTANGKANASHTHNVATSDASGFMSRSQCNKLNSTTDYVVAQGTSGIWTYRKYNSGIAECWGTVSKAFTAWSSWGSGYETNTFTPATAFPFTFTGVPKVVSEGYCNNGIGIYLESCGNHTASKSAEYYGVRPNNNAPTGTLYVAIHALGRWK